MDWAEVYDALGCLKTSLESRQHSSGMTNIENAPRLGIASVRRRCVQEWDIWRRRSPTQLGPVSHIEDYYYIVSQYVKWP